jgi:hypothetical protein
MAILTLGLQNLRRQVDAAFPDRDKRSDGWIGDDAHKVKTSGHNPDDTTGSKPAWDGDPDSVEEVRAWDCDSDFGPDVTAQQVVDHIRALPGLSNHIRYMIYNGREYHARNHFSPIPYTGAPHTEHIHFEGAWTQASDNDRSYDYQMEELMAIDYEKIRGIVADEVDKALHALDYTPEGTTVPRRTIADVGLMESRRAKMQAELAGRLDAAEARIVSAIATRPTA